VIACEGSMFKSKWANALTTMMAGALGIANSEKKVSIGYGAEAGEMTPEIKRFVSKHCKNSFIICRNNPTRTVLHELGLRTAGGTDTAWTFEGAPKERAVELLRGEGWDEKMPILAICPVNPFWWPVRPSLVKAATRHFTGLYQEEHYKSIYFHEYSQERKAKYEKYLDHIAFAVTEFLKQKKVFPVLIGMERLDRRACLHLARRLPYFPPIFSSDEYNMYELGAILRKASLMISSRYHAIVTSMPAKVPSIGITMDERIRNIMIDRGHPNLFLEVDDPDLGDRLFLMLKHLDRDHEKIADEIGYAVPKQLRLMGQMGIDFMDEIVRVYPDFPRRNIPRSWEHYLPPLGPTIRKILENYA